MVNPEYMNWIVLVIAGFFEAGLPFVWENERTLGHRVLLLGSRIPYLSGHQHGIAGQSGTYDTYWYGLSRVDRYRCGKYGGIGYYFLS